MHASFWSWWLVVLLAAPAQPEGRMSDPCSLISAAEIQEIQGEKVTAITASAAPTLSALDVSRCFYSLPTFTRSISLELTRRSAEAPPDKGPREHWNRLFHSDDSKEDADAARPIAGLGEEAFWTGDAPVGALYVLVDDVYLRVSIGSGEEESLRIDKSRRLAEKAVHRLRSSQ